MPKKTVGEYTPDELERQADRLAKFADKIRDVRSMMLMHGVDRMQALGKSSRTKAVNALQVYTNELEKGIMRVIEGRDTNDLDAGNGIYKPSKKSAAAAGIKKATNGRRRK